MHCNKRIHLAFFLGLVFPLLTLTVEPIDARPVEAIAQKYISNGCFQVGDKKTLQHRTTELFTPASTIKILTSLVALKTLGENFTFTTKLYLDKQYNLYIKGGGDPFLTSEAVLTICKQLQEKYPTVKKIGTIFLDTSFFTLNGWQVSTEHSDNPYDAPNGALAVNFNAIPIEVAADGTISSGEKQTPLLPIMQQKAKQLNLGVGKYRINVACKKGCRGNYAGKESEAATLSYAAQLFVAQLRGCHIEANGNFAKKRVPAGLTPALVYKSEKTLAEMVRLLLRHSNNFVANQIFLTLGAITGTKKGERDISTWKAARQYAALFFEQTVHIPPQELIMVEGSGLSMDNKITCRAFVTALNAFRPWAKLLRKRRNILLKSGTMPKSGVFSYAGYFTNQKKQTPYALLLNQQKNTRNQLLQQLAKRGYCPAARDTPLP